MTAFNTKLDGLNELIKNLGRNKSPFFMGTRNPTQLDIHSYCCLSRPFFMQGSVFNDTLFAHMNFSAKINERVTKFIEAMQAREEFQTSFSLKKTHHEYFAEVIKTPKGTKVPLWLPMTH